MKLKKIVSLAAAALMAVSMLAGCNGNTKPTDPTDPVEPGISGVSADVKARVEKKLDKTLPNYITFSDSAELNSDLEYAVEYAGVMDILPGYIDYDAKKLTGVEYDDNIKVRLDEAIDATGTVNGDIITIWNIGKDSVLQKAEDQNGYKIDDARAVGLYAVSSAIGKNAINQLVAEEIAAAVDSYKYSIENTNGGNYNHEYTVSVSTYTKAVNSSVVGVIGTGVGAEDPAVTFIAVQVVRTSTHQ